MLATVGLEGKWEFGAFSKGALRPAFPQSAFLAKRSGSGLKCSDAMWDRSRFWRIRQASGLPQATLT